MAQDTPVAAEPPAGGTPPALDSGTYGELPDEIRPLIQGYEWDNMSRERQRVWLIERLASSRSALQQARTALEEIAALPIAIEHHGCLPEDAWSKRDEIWQSDDFFWRKTLVLQFASILRQQTHDIACAALTPSPPGTRNG